MPIFPVLFTYFQLRFWYVLKERKPGILWVRCPFSHESGWVQLICHVLLTHHKTYFGGRSYSSTADNLLDFCTNKKLSIIYRHELIVIYCALMKHRALLTIQAKLAIKLIIIFLLFGHDTIWQIPRKRVARGGKLWSCETLLYPDISNYSGNVFAVLGKSCYSFQHMWNLEWSNVELL